MAIATQVGLSSLESAEWGDIIEESVLSNTEEVIVVDEWLGHSDFTTAIESCCRTPIKTFQDIGDPSSICKSAYHILSSLDINKNSSCLYNELFNCMSVLSYLSKSKLVVDNQIIACVDAYLRTRHDVLHRLSMLSLGITQHSTDVRFCDVLPIDSKRTPDYINVSGNTVIICETTVSTDKGKSYMSKGRIEAGYQSKYQKEIDILKLMDYNVHYVVLHFDSKDIFNEEYKHEIKNLSALLQCDIRADTSSKLEIIRRCVVAIQSSFSNILSPYMSMLFTDEFHPVYHPLHIMSDMMTKDCVERCSFSRMTLSSNIFNKIITGWPRLLRMAEVIEPDIYILSFDLVTNKLSFKPDRQGIHLDEWNDILVHENRIDLIKNMVTTVTGSKVVDISGKIEYFTKNNRILTDADNDQFTLHLHQTTSIFHTDKPLPDYSAYLMENEFIKMGSKYEDVDYDSKIQKMLLPIFEYTEDQFNKVIGSLKHKSPFIINKVSKEMFDNAKTQYEIAYKSDNDLINNPRNIRHQKTAFLYPLVNPNSVSYIDYRTKDVDFLTAVFERVRSPFTSLCIGKFLEQSFEFGSRPQPEPEDIRKLNEQWSGIQRQIHRIQIQNKKDGVLLKAKDMPECKNLLSELKQLRRDLGVKCKQLNYKKSKISVCRLPTRNKKRLTGVGAMFRLELQHFKTKEEHSVYKGVGRFNYDILSREYQEIKLSLLGLSREICPDELYDDHVAEDAKLLQQLKQHSLDNNRMIYTTIKNTNIYGSCAIITRLCYTLMYFSQTAIGSDYVFADNLGLKNCLLICKGGKKIFRTKKSKFYKLFYPTYKSCVAWVNRPGYQSDYKVHDIAGETVIETPWMFMDETILSDGLTLLSKTMGFLLMNKNLSHDFDDVKRLCFFNILLSLNARRQTEEFMHSMRYITANCISEVASVDKMLPTLSGFNYDFMQCFLRESLLQNFVPYACSLKEMHDITTGRNPDIHLEKSPIRHIFDVDVEIRSSEQLTLVIYCTFLMSKAPVTQSLEQVSNWREMLSTDQLYSGLGLKNMSEAYEKNTTTADNQDVESYWNSIFKNDFNYDPKYVTFLGNFCSDYLEGLIGKDKLHQDWNKVLDDHWDRFANTKGLRGELGTKAFFGRKGYYVVYQEVMKDEGLLAEIKNLLLSDDQDDNKRRKLRKMNQSFKTKLNQSNLNLCVFHVVDKRQRGGGREIYVMDLYTKIHQQPIERFIGMICKEIPNEMISVPSNRRLHNIHSTFHEKMRGPDDIFYNITFDCRRWAPHSVITKFVDFIIGMRKVLPRSFLIHCLTFFEKMHDSKRVYTKNYVYEIMEKNASLKGIVSDRLKKDTDTDAYYLEMSYSWMMGIFNYMSSLLHVINQLHISYVTNLINTKLNFSDLNLHMKAHSDDSAGKLSCTSDTIMRRTMFCYELLMKSCNHMLSDKKCNISLSYFEFLSTLYLGDRLLSLLPKFVGSFSFHPTDKGYCSDIMECYSKVIELIINGATFEQAYLALKIMTQMIYRFYFSKKIDKIYYSYPPQLSGVPDAHPLSILLSGSDSDALRLRLFGRNVEFGSILSLSKHLTGFDSLDDSFIPPINSEPLVYASKELKELSGYVWDLDEDLTWLVKNLSTDNTPMSLLKYLTLLKDKHFLASMQDETLTRRISRAYHSISAKNLRITLGNISYRDLREIINLHYCFATNIVPGEGMQWSDVVSELVNEPLEKLDHSYFDILHSEVILMLKGLDAFDYSRDQLQIERKTCKPIHVNVQRVVSPMPTNFKPDNLTAWIKYPKIRWMLPPADYTGLTMLAENYLLSKGLNIADCEANWLQKLLRKFKGKFLKDYFLYSNMPASTRDINNYKDVLTFLSHNSFQNKYITGLVSPYNRTINVAFQNIFSDYLSEEVQTMLDLLDFSSGLINDDNMYEKFDELAINGTDEKGFQGLMSLIKSRSLILEETPELQKLILPSLICLENRYGKNETSQPAALSNSFFHCFVKKQHLVGNVWLGKGRLYINTPHAKMVLEIENQTLVKITSDVKGHIFSRYEVSYIDYVLASAQINNLSTHLLQVDPKSWNKLCFGLNSSGCYEICEGRFLKTCIRNYELNKLPHVTLSNIHLCKVKIIPRSKFSVSSDIDEMNKFIIHTFDMQTPSVLKTVTGILDNAYNRELIMNKGDMFADFLNVLVGETTNADYKTDLKVMYEHYQLSEIYNIMYSCQKTEAVNFSRLQLRPKFYPAQEDGLLHLLIEYKKENPNFLFNPNIIVTPELMHLKSTQPTAFMSNLVTNIKEKYNSLYTEIDKSIIVRKLGHLVDILGTDEFDAEIMSVLRSWGFIGVMGGLGEISFEKNPKGFLSLYFDKSKQIYETYLSLLPKLLDALVGAVKNTEVYRRLQDLGYQENMTEEGFMRRLRSFLYSCVIRSYTSGSMFIFNNLTVPLIDFNNMLYALYTDTQFLIDFEANLSNIYLLNTLPIKQAHAEDMIRSIQSMISVIILNRKQKCEILKWQRFYRLPADVVNFKTIMEDITKDNFLNSLRHLHYSGTMNTNYVGEVRGLKVFQYNGNWCCLDVDWTGVSNTRIPLNKNWVVEGVISANAIENDSFMDFQIELDSDEPDEDTMQYFLDELEEASVQLYEEKEEVKKLVRVSGNFLKLKVKSVKFVNLIGSSVESFNYLRQVGDNILVVSDVLHNQLISEKMCSEVLVFDNIPTYYQTIYHPRHLIFYLISKDEQLLGPICKLFSLKKVDKWLLERELVVQTYACYYNVKGMLINDKVKLSMEEEYEKLFSISENIRQAREEHEKVISKDEAQQQVIEEVSKNKGIVVDESLLTKYLEPIKNNESDITKWDLKEYISNVMSGVHTKKSFETEVKKILEKPKTSYDFEKIYEVPEALSTSTDRHSDIKNKALKDNRLRAEIEALCAGIMDNILSNTLSLSEKMYKKMKVQLRLWSTFVKTCLVQKKNKLFMIDLVKLVANDGNSSGNDSRDDAKWENIIEKVGEIIVQEELEEDIEHVYTDEPRQGSLSYRLFPT